jgi:dTDP-4-dehydrorhamnose reductase
MNKGMNFDFSKVLITGAGGMIGQAIPWGIKLTRNELDLTSPQSIQKAIDQHRPNCVLHLAGVDIRHCEKNPFLAYKTNVSGTYELASELKKRSIPVVFISSASIFNGPHGTLFDEKAKPEPLHIYGHTKVLSEQFLQCIIPDQSLVIRTGWIFGGHGAHFRKFVDVAIESAKSDQPITASSDQPGSPTYIKDFVQAIEDCISKKRTGIIHVFNSYHPNQIGVTAAEVAKIILECLPHSKSKLIIQSAKSILESNSTGQILRSPCEALSTIHNLKLRSWDLALREYVGQSR